MKPSNNEPRALSTARKHQLIRYFLAVGAVSALLASLIHLHQAYYYLAAAELLIVLTALYFLLIRRDAQSIVPLIPFITPIIFITFAVGAFSQQDSLISLVWIPAYPIIYFYLTDCRRGMIWALLSVLTLIVGYLLHPYLFHSERIPLLALIQSISAFSFVTALSYFYELVRARQEHHLRLQADLDYLTRIYNRRGFSQRLRIELSRVQRYGTRLSYLLLDVDNFKQVNDNYGHKGGDRLLQELAQLLMHSIRKSDVLARWGGEEFALLLPEADLDQALSLAEKLRQNVAEHPFESVGHITVSIGVSQYRINEVEDLLLQRADQALYRAKAEGKNRVAYETSTL